MHPDPLESAATGEGVPVAPALAPSVENLRLPVERSAIDRRVVVVCALAIALAIVTGLVAQLLVA
ncbi:MAG TPA: hypothetical protein VF698_04930, partial [Thermoanaerobaculia bacterium]